MPCKAIWILRESWKQGGKTDPWLSRKESYSKKIFCPLDILGLACRSPFFTGWGDAERDTELCFWFAIFSSLLGDFGFASSFSQLLCNFIFVLPFPCSLNIVFYEDIIFFRIKYTDPTYCMVILNFYTHISTPRSRYRA